jgi:hypothetical protein
MIQVWKIAPGKRAENWKLFRDHGCIGLGWLVNSDYRDFKSRDAVLAALEKEYGKGARGASAGSAKMIWQFVHEVNQHHVVVANEGYNRVVGVGEVTSSYLPPNSAENPLREDITTHRHHVRRVNWLITVPVDLPSKRFFIQSTLWRLSNEKLASIRQAYARQYPRLRAKLERLSVGYQAGVSGLLSAEVEAGPELPEGAVRKISVNAYERNREARQMCIDAHGTNCCICGFSFGAVYGPEAEGDIEVHHMRPLSKIGKQYNVNPVKDLRPVCANCHAVLHLGGELKSIDEVKQLLAKRSQGQTRRYS